MLEEEENPFADDDVFNDPSVTGALSQSQDDSALSFHEPVRVPSANSSLLSGKIGAIESPPTVKEAVAVPTGFCSVLSVDYYRPFFDIDTNDVRVRLLRVMMPWKSDFFAIVDGKPDFYGPFWICATLIFMIAATSNLSSWLGHTGEAEPWQHDFTVLSFATSLVFGFAVAMPFVAWGVFSFLGVSTSNISFVELACVYGYSIAAFIPACLLCSIPASWLEWLSVITFLSFSTVFLVRNLWERLGVEEGGYMPPSMEVDPEQGVTGNGGKKSAAIFLFGLCGLHFVFALILKTYFFGAIV